MGGANGLDSGLVYLMRGHLTPLQRHIAVSKGNVTGEKEIGKDEEGCSVA
jgi:hypothetical protein